MPPPSKKYDFILSQCTKTTKYILKDIALKYIYISSWKISETSLSKYKLIKIRHIHCVLLNRSATWRGKPDSASFGFYLLPPVHP